MPKYKKRADGRYQHQVNVDINPDGTYKRKTVYGKTIAELEEKVRAAKNMYEQGVDLTTRKPTVKMWADRWLEVYKKDLGHYAMHGYHIYINKWLAPVHGIQIDKVRPIQLQEILQSAAREVGQSSVNKLWNTIKGVFGTAAQNGLTPFNVCERLTKPTGGKAGRRDALNPDEIKAMTETCKIDENGLLPALMMYGGLRLGEALALTYGDLSDGHIRVNKTLTLGEGSNKTVVKNSPKTDAGVRNVPLLPIPAELLEKARKNHTDSDYIFTHKKGELLSKTRQRALWNKILTTYSAQFPGGIAPRLITAHQLRHTYISLLYDAGVDVKTAQKWAGHSSVTITLEIYTHLSKQKEDDAENALRDFVLKTTS